MSATEKVRPLGMVVLRSAAELGAVTALVFATGWGGARLAAAVHRYPVGPGREGIIELRLAKSDRRGDVTFEEGSGYAGWWHCRGNDWAVEWKLAPKTAGPYRIEALLANPARTPEARVEIVIGEQVRPAPVPDTGGPSKWKKLDLGVVSLETKAYSLIVRPSGPDGATNLNLKSVTLRPAETGQFTKHPG